MSRYGNLNDWVLRALINGAHETICIYNGDAGPDCCQISDDFSCGFCISDPSKRLRFKMALRDFDFQFISSHNNFKFEYYKNTESFNALKMRNIYRLIARGYLVGMDHISYKGSSLCLEYGGEFEVSPEEIKSIKEFCSRFYNLGKMPKLEDLDEAWDLVDRIFFNITDYYVCGRSFGDMIICGSNVNGDVPVFLEDFIHVCLEALGFKVDQDSGFRSLEFRQEIEMKDVYREDAFYIPEGGCVLNFDRGVVPKIQTFTMPSSLFDNDTVSGDIQDDCFKIVSPMDVTSAHGDWRSYRLMNITLDPGPSSGSNVNEKEKEISSMLKTIFEWDNDKANGSVYKWDDSEDESVAVLKTKTRNGEEFILVKGDIKPLIQGDGIDIEKAKETCQIITLSKDEFIKLSSCIYK